MKGLTFDEARILREVSAMVGREFVDAELPTVDQLIARGLIVETPDHRRRVLVADATPLGHLALRLHAALRMAA